MKTLRATIFLAMLILTVFAILTLAFAGDAGEQERGLLPSLKDYNKRQQNENKGQNENHGANQNESHEHRPDANVYKGDPQGDGERHYAHHGGSWGRLRSKFGLSVFMYHPHDSGYAFAPPSGGYGGGYGYGGGRVPNAGFGSCYSLMLAAEQTGNPTFWNSFNDCMAGPH